MNTSQLVLSFLTPTFFHILMQSKVLNKIPRETLPPTFSLCIFWLFIIFSNQSSPDSALVGRALQNIFFYCYYFNGSLKQIIIIHFQVSAHMHAFSKIVDHVLCIITDNFLFNFFSISSNLGFPRNQTASKREKVNDPYEYFTQKWIVHISLFFLVSKMWVLLAHPLFSGVVQWNET